MHIKNGDLFFLLHYLKFLSFNLHILQSHHSLFYTSYDTPFNVRRDLVRNTHVIAMYVSYNECIQPEDGFYSRNMLLTVNYKQSRV